MTILNFRREVEKRSTSWTRADPTDAMIQQVAWDRWIVTLKDSDDVYAVDLREEHGAFDGSCRALSNGQQCPGFKHHDGPCAHLCTIRKAAFAGTPDVNNTPVRIRSVEQKDRDRGEEAVESIATDGGRHL